MKKDKQPKNNGTAPESEPVTEDKATETQEEKTQAHEEPAAEVSAEAILKEKHEKEIAEMNNKYLMLAAEYENFRRRSAKEKEACYSDACVKVVSEFLPLIDTFERAVAFTAEGSEENSGTQKMLKQAFEIMAKLGIKEIEADGKTFDPNLHYAVLHEEDDSENHDIITATLQKGYIYGDRVIRHSMVKVLN